MKIKIYNKFIYENFGSLNSRLVNTRCDQAHVYRQLFTGRNYPVGSRRVK